MLKKNFDNIVEKMDLLHDEHLGALEDKLDHKEKSVVLKSHRLN